MANDKNQQMKLVGEALAAAIEAIGCQPREGQIQMAEAVANALTDRHHLLVQAGTGTGKSLAYLVPALVHGKKVLVATATLALQRQLVERDLPKIQPALEKVLKRDLTFAVYKGVGNYLCLQKMNGAEQDPDGDVLMEIGALEEVKNFQAKIESGAVREDAPLTKSLGFQPLVDFLKNRISRDEAITQAQTETRQYAKRQMTWFRHQL